MTIAQAVFGWTLIAASVYPGLYVGARATHFLVRNGEGCVSRPGGASFDPVPSCADLARIDLVEGRTFSQDAFRPLIWLEERVRGPAEPRR